MDVRNEDVNESIGRIGAAQGSQVNDVNFPRAFIERLSPNKHLFINDLLPNIVNKKVIIP